MMKREQKKQLDLSKFLKTTGLAEEDVFRALKIPDDIKWTYTLSKCEGLRDSWSALSKARSELVKNPELLSKLAGIHDSRALKTINENKGSKSLFDVLAHSVVDSPAYTRAGELLVKMVRRHKSLAKLNQMLSGSKNEELVRSSRRKLSEACRREISKKRLALSDLSKLRESAKNLTPLNEAHRLINENYDKSLKSFLNRPHTVDKLCSIQRYVELGKELGQVNNKITELVIKECKEGGSFWRASRMLYRCRHMLENPHLHECMTLLEKRAKTFNELLSIFNRFTRSDSAKELRVKILNKLIDFAKTQKQLIYMYNMELISDLTNNSHKPKIIRKLVENHAKKN
jgi:hypothetical protein